MEHIHSCLSLATGAVHFYECEELRCDGVERFPCNPCGAQAELLARGIDKPTKEQIFEVLQKVVPNLTYRGTKGSQWGSSSSWTPVNASLGLSHPTQFRFYVFSYWVDHKQRHILVRSRDLKSALTAVSEILVGPSAQGCKNLEMQTMDAPFVDLATPDSKVSK